MAAKDLITLARAYQNLQGVSGVDALINTLITAYSEAIEKYCRRYFVSRAFDELYNGNGDRRLLLRQYPVQSVRWVRYRPVTVVKVINNNTNLNQRATVRITGTGLNLERVASGVVTNDASITWAGNATLNAVVTAINALGNGWSAQVVGDSGQGSGTGDYGLWPSADLYVAPSYGDGVESQGALTARGQNAELKMHTYELAGYQWDARGWLLRAIPYTDPELLHPEDLIWPVGVNNFRVQYTAGYTTIPEAVQQACAEWVAVEYYETLRDPALSHQVPASGTTSGWTNPAGRRASDPPPRIKALLAPYRRLSYGTNQG